MPIFIDRGAPMIFKELGTRPFVWPVETVQCPRSLFDAGSWQHPESVEAQAPADKSSRRAVSGRGAFNDLAVRLVERFTVTPTIRKRRSARR